MDISLHEDVIIRLTKPIIKGAALLSYIFLFKFLFLLIYDLYLFPKKIMAIGIYLLYIEKKVHK